MKTISQLPSAATINGGEYLVLERPDGTHKVDAELLRLEDINKLMSYEHVQTTSYPASAYSNKFIDFSMVPSDLYGDLAGQTIVINGSTHTFSITPATYQELQDELRQAFDGIRFSADWMLIIESDAAFDLSGSVLDQLGLRGGSYVPDVWEDTYIADAMSIYFEGGSTSLDSEIWSIRSRIDTLENAGGGGGSGGGSVTLYGYHIAESSIGFASDYDTVESVFGADIFDADAHPFEVNGHRINPAGGSEQTILEWLEVASQTLKYYGLEANLSSRWDGEKNNLAVEFLESQSDNTFTLSGAGAELLGFEARTYEGYSYARDYDVEASRIWVPNAGKFLDDYLSDIENRLAANGM